MNEIVEVENDEVGEISAGDILKIGGSYFLVCEYESESLDIFCLKTGVSPWVTPVFKERIVDHLNELYGNWSYLGRCKIQIMRI